MDIAGVDVEIDIIKEYPELEDLIVNPSTEDQNFNSSKYGFKSVKINAIKGEELDLNPSTEQQNVEGVFTKVKLNPIKTQKLSAVPSTKEQVMTGLFDEVTVNAIEGEELNLNPSEKKQNFEGVFLTVHIDPIQTEEITTDLDFSDSDAIELTAQEGAYIKKATINKDVNLTPENIKSGVSISGIQGDVADTSDADATSNDIALGKTAYVNNQKVTGVMEVNDNNALVGTTISAGSSNYSGLNKIITKIPDDLIISGTDIRNMFYYCSGLTEINIDTSGVETTVQTFSYCLKLTKLSQLEASKFKATQSMFLQCPNLQDFGGLLNLGKSFDKKESYSPYHTLDLSSSTKLTHESLMNIINNLYDLN